MARYKIVNTQLLSLTLLVVSAYLAPPSIAYAEQRTSNRPLIEKKDDLPRRSYRVSVPVSELYAEKNRDALLALAAQLRSDINSDLQTFDIRDNNTVQGFYGALGSTAMLEEDWQGYLNYLQKRRELESKDANRLSMGLIGEAVAESHLSGDSSGKAVAERLRENIAKLPYAPIQDSLNSLKGQTEILTRDFVLASLESRYQPVIDRNDGAISYDIAASLIGVTFTLDHLLPAAADVRNALVAIIDANRVEKTNIWAERQVALDGTEDGSPVVIAIWDSGVDTQIFSGKNQLWTNADERPGNNIDDDGNGYIDDIHGIAYDIDSQATPELLYPIATFDEDRSVLESRIKGLGDIQFNVDSDEASQVRSLMASLEQSEVPNFLESLSAYANFSHGTHVSGIALQGNPWAQLLVTRMTYGHTLIPPKPTLAAAHREAAMFLEVAEYFRANNVRVVNMSWGGSLGGIEAALEANADGDTPAERKALAREIFAIGDAALRRAISESPEILFVTSSGNSDNDVKFDEFYPSSYEFPNLLTVGAVDIAGDETSFTSLGKVDVYGNGFEVESYVPGGNRIAFNGTSMSSPQVANLAGKVLALYPQLSVTALRQLIIDASDLRELETRTIRLINPAATLALAETRSATLGNPKSDAAQP